MKIPSCVRTRDLPPNVYFLLRSLKIKVSYMAIYLTPRHIKASNYVYTQSFYVHRNVTIINIGGNFQEFFPPLLQVPLLSCRRDYCGPNIWGNLRKSSPQIFRFLVFLENRRWGGGGGCRIRDKIKRSSYFKSPFYPLQPPFCFTLTSYAL